VRWFLQNRGSSAAFSGAAGNTPVNTNIVGNGDVTLGQNLLGAGVGAVFPGFAYALRAANATVTLNALNAVTNVNVISTPSLTVLDNRQAVLQVGDQVAIQTFSGTNLAAAGNSAFNGTTYRDTGVILAITPHINESGKVLLELEQEVSNVAPGQQNSLTPTIQQRKVKTQVVVNNNEALMLGGLIQDNRSKSADQIPVLGDVPIIGNAFKEKDDQIRKTELLIMITPHVVRSLDEAREITDEFKRKLLGIATKAKVRPHDIEQSTRRVLLDDWSAPESRLDKVSR
jgi:general secretion pathway protein D